MIAPTAATGADINVSAGRTTPAINGTLERWGTISGVVTRDSAPALGPLGARVTAYRLIGNEWVVQADQTLPYSIDGKYTLRQLPPGTYRLKFRAPGYVTEFWDDQSTLAAAGDIVLAPGAVVADRNARLAGAGRIAGRITDAGGSPVPDTDVGLYLRDGDYWSYQGNATSDADGSYELSSLDPGEYRLRFLRAGYLVEYWNNKPTIDTATSITVSRSQAVTGKNAVLARGARLSGTVRSSAGSPLAGVEVIALQPYSGGGWAPAARARTASNGTYSFLALPAGSYRLRYTRIDTATEYNGDTATLAEAPGVVLRE